MLNVREIVQKMRRMQGFEFVNSDARRRLSAVHYAINSRAALAARIAAVAVNGRVGVVTSGMDCDCVQYRRESIRDVPESIFAAWRAREEDYESADGPMSISYVRPDECEDGHYVSRDRALEAFEDGHAHYVYAGTLD